MSYDVAAYTLYRNNKNGQGVERPERGGLNY
jgi:hypothetical protein